MARRFNRMMTPALIAENKRRIIRAGGRPSDCHPTRRAHVGTMCRECYQVRHGLDPGDKRPPIFFDAEQKAAVTLPSECPKCGAVPPSWRIRPDGGYGSCVMCGGDLFLSSGRITTLRSSVESRPLGNRGLERK